MIEALAAAEPLDLGGARVTGLTLPHHRVASDLMAVGFLTAAQGPPPERIVILSPDHFFRSPRPFASTSRDLATYFGTLRVDRAVVRALIDSPDVAYSTLFEHEHGVGELTPYVAILFPDVPVVPIAVSAASTRAECDELVELLAGLLGPTTLIVQSTDFSHYLGVEDARCHDQQMLDVIAAGDLDALTLTRQPDHLDSKGSQYIQMKLQERLFHAKPHVYANRNSADTGATSTESTTSYIAQVYAPDAQDRVLLPPDWSHVRTTCVAGDAFFGRYVDTQLAHPERRARLLEELTRRLCGCPLVVNLEGVTTDDGSARGPLDLAMPRDETFEWLRALDVVAVGVANNHGHDHGQDALDAMVAGLRANGTIVLEHGRTEIVGPLRMTAFSDLDNSPVPRGSLIGLDEIAALPPIDDAPHVAFVHWGREFVVDPGPRETFLADALNAAGARIVVGAHPHAASRKIELLDGMNGLLVYSLGNFIFDQHGPKVSGAVLQIDVFPQGTWWVRQVKLPDASELWAYSSPGFGPSAGSASSGKCGTK